MHREVHACMSPGATTTGTEAFGKAYHENVIQRFAYENREAGKAQEASVRNASMQFHNRLHTLYFDMMPTIILPPIMYSHS